MADQGLSSGIISNGWVLTLVSGNPIGYTGDNAVTVTASVGFVAVSNPFTYYVTVTNYGPSISTNVTVSDALPAGLSLISDSATIGYVQSGVSSLTWSLGNLNSNAVGQLTLNMYATSPGTYVNTASVTSDTPDDNPDDDSGSATVVVGTPAPPVLSAIAITSGHKFQFAITSLPGQTNVVQASTNLANPNGWVPVWTNVGPFTFMDPQSTNIPTRFYRDVITGP